MEYRIEKDSLGEKQIESDAYYGINAARAYENFKITYSSCHSVMIESIAQIKKAAAIANFKGGAISEDVCNGISEACDEIISGKIHDAFVVDPLQGGAGTSFNMNANEVIANRAIEILGGTKGDYSIVHPNDTVNCGQSTNDVYPTSGRLTAIKLLNKAIVEIESLRQTFMNKSEEFKDVVKMGRTEMEDAVPTTLGKSFHAYASAFSRDIERFRDAVNRLSTVNMGATAIGTGITANDYYMDHIAEELSNVVGMKLTQAEDLIDATQNADTFAFVSGAIKACAVTLSKVSNDLRLMASGPRCGFGEIELMPMQSGSSIMPGKINPVIPELMSEISFRIIGNDTTITMACEAGQLELNAFEPVMFMALFESLDILTNGLRTFNEKCVNVVKANADVCRRQVESSAGLATALSPYIGYAKASEIAKQSLREKRTVKEIAFEQNIMTDRLDTILDVKNMM